jgi:hypothetical protein
LTPEKLEPHKLDKLPVLGVHVDSSESKDVPTVYLKYPLTDKQFKTLNKRHPYVKFICAPSGLIHPHGVAHAERNLAELTAFRSFRKQPITTVRWVNVPRSRTSTFKKQQCSHWSSVPRLKIEDNFRDGDCECFEECSCVDHNVIVFENCMHLTDLRTVAFQLLTDKQVFSIHMQYPAPEGTLYDGELCYNIQHDGRLNVFASGNTMSYLDDPLFYSQQTIKVYKGLHLVYNNVATVGNLVVRKYQILRGDAPTVPRITDFIDNIHNYEEITNIDAVKHEMLDRLNLKSARAYSFGPFVVFVGSDDASVTVPKSLISLLLRSITLQPRNEGTFNNLRSRAQQWLRDDKEHYIPPSKTSLVMLAAVVYSFYSTIHAESQMLSQNINQSVAEVNRINLLLKMQNPKPWFETLKDYLVELCGNTMLVYIFHRFLLNFPKALQLLHPKLQPFVLKMLTIPYYKHVIKTCFLAAVAVPTVKHFWPETMIDRRPMLDVLAHYGRTFNSLKLPSGVYKYFTKVLPRKTFNTPYSPMRENSSLEYVNEPEPKQQYVNVCGPVVADCIPVVPASNQQNEIIAIRNRIVLKTPKPDEKVWRDLRSRLTTDMYEKAFHFIQEFKPANFKKWLAQFPKATQNRLLKTKELMDSIGPAGHRDFIRKMFIKAEKLDWNNLAEPEEKSPRAISSVSDMANLMLGPSMMGYTKHQKRALHGDPKDFMQKNHQIIYCAEFTPEAIGKMVAHAHNEGLQYVYENDHTRFDAHVNKYAIELESWLYTRAGLKGHALDAFKAQRSTVGYSRHGVKYSVEATRKSGDPNTSIGNSMINAITMYYALDIAYSSNKGIKHGLRDVKFLMLVMGDDNLLLTNHPLDMPKTNTVLTQLGFTPKFCERNLITEAEFCSSRFVPIENDSLLLVPKAGRIYSRLCITCKPVKNRYEWLAGTLLGQRYNLMVIPGGRVFYKKCMELLMNKGVDITSVKVNQERHNFYAKEEHTLDEFQFNLWLKTIYNLDMADIRSLEQFFEQELNDLDLAMSHPVLTRFCEVDCSLQPN